MEVNDCMVNVPLLILPAAGLLLFLIINPTTMQIKTMHTPNTPPTTAGIIIAIDTESVVIGAESVFIGAEFVVKLNVVNVLALLTVITLVEVVRG